MQKNKIFGIQWKDSNLILYTFMAKDPLKLQPICLAAEIMSFVWIPDPRLTSHKVVPCRSKAAISLAQFTRLLWSCSGSYAVLLWKLSYLFLQYFQSFDNLPTNNKCHCPIGSPLLWAFSRDLQSRSLSRQKAVLSQTVPCAEPCSVFICNTHSVLRIQGNIAPSHLLKFISVSTTHK